MKRKLFTALTALIFMLMVVCYATQPTGASENRVDEEFFCSEVAIDGTTACNDDCTNDKAVSSGGGSGGLAGGSGLPDDNSAGDEDCRAADNDHDGYPAVRGLMLGGDGGGLLGGGGGFLGGGDDDEDDNSPDDRALIWKRHEDIPDDGKLYVLSIESPIPGLLQIVYSKKVWQPELWMAVDEGEMQRVYDFYDYTGEGLMINYLFATWFNKSTLNEYTDLILPLSSLEHGHVYEFEVRYEDGGVSMDSIEVDLTGDKPAYQLLDGERSGYGRREQNLPSDNTPQRPSSGSSQANDSQTIFEVRDPQMIPDHAATMIATPATPTTDVPLTAKLKAVSPLDRFKEVFQARITAYLGKTASARDDSAEQGIAPSEPSPGSPREANSDSAAIIHGASRSTNPTGAPGDQTGFAAIVDPTAIQTNLGVTAQASPMLVQQTFPVLNGPNLLYQDTETAATKSLPPITLLLILSLACLVVMVGLMVKKRVGSS